MTKLAEWMDAHGKDAAAVAGDIGMSYEHVHRVAKGELVPGDRFVMAFWRKYQLDIEDVTEILSREATA